MRAIYSVAISTPASTGLLLPPLFFLRSPGRSRPPIIEQNWLFFAAPRFLERRNFSDLKRPKEATIEAVLVKEQKQYAVAVSLSRCSSERRLLELVLSVLVAFFLNSTGICTSSFCRFIWFCYSCPFSLHRFWVSGGLVRS
ncbi:unnamed protein product [Musa hybrid cultivar]